MAKQMLRSVAAVGAGVFMAVLGVVVTPPLLMFVLGQFSAAYLQAHLPTVMLLIAAIGAIAVAVLAGIAIGALSPSRPVLHSLAAAVVMTGVSAAVAGTQGLPHGWQILTLLLQVLLMMAVAALAWRHWRVHTSVDAQAI